MDIGLVIYNDLDTLTGGYLYDKQLVTHLRAKGHTVSIIAVPMRPYLRRLGDNLDPELGRQLRSASFDVLLQDELCHPSFFLRNRRLRQQARYPVVAIVHQVLSDEPRRSWQNTLYRLPEKHYLAGVDGFVFNSRTTRETVARLVGRTIPGVIASPAGDRLKEWCDLTGLEGRVAHPGPLRLLFLGNVIPRKGLLPLLEALAAIPEDVWRLQVIGSLEMDRSYVRRIRRCLADKALTERVDLAGVRNNRELAEVLARSDVLCMPYAYEGFGIVFMEAMAFGLPVLGSCLGAVAEMVSHGENGFLLQPDNAPGLRDIITLLQGDRLRLLAMSRAALTRFAAHPTWQESMAQIELFLHEMHNAPSRRGLPL